jgi:hypothetical protein
MFDYKIFDLLLEENRLVLLCKLEYRFLYYFQVAKQNELYNKFGYHNAKVLQDELQFHLNKEISIEKFIKANPNFFEFEHV